MHHPPKLREVGLRLQSAFDLLPDPPDDPEDQMERWVSLCIAFLDAEHAEHRPGELEAYLRLLMQVRELELGLIAFPQSQAPS